MIEVKDLTVPDERDAFDELAGKLEFDANLTKREAERKALEFIQKKRELF